ncbi:MAG: hypothetical protein DWQ10_12210, partial [Calditrichaeota bacterium]
RGDRVSVEAFDFPVKSDYFNQLSKRKNVDSTKQAAFSPTLFPDEKKAAGMDWQPFIFAAIIAGVFLIILFWGMNSILKKLGQEQPRAETPSPPVKKEDVPKEMSQQDAETASFNSLKTSVLDAIIGTPKTAARVIKQWIQLDEKNGPRDAALLFCSTSKNLNQFLAEDLGPQISADIQMHIDELPAEEITEKGPEIIRRFDENLRDTALSAIRNEEKTDALAFLHQLTDDQLQHLIKPLKDGVRAIVLAQLPAKRAFSLIKSLDPRKQPSALAAMGNVERVPADVYQHIAKQLLNRAREIDKMRYVRADGIDALVNILDYMDDLEQEELLEYIETQDMNLAQRIKTKYMTFNQLMDLPSERVRDFALNVDRDLLAKSLIHVDEMTVNRIISSLPDKLAEMVQASLEASSEVSDEEITLARRQLMRSVRKSDMSKEIIK